MLTITLDESDCFAAWVSAKDAGFSSPDGSDPKREFVSFLLSLLQKEKVDLCSFLLYAHFFFVFKRYMGFFKNNFSRNLYIRSCGMENSILR